MNTTDLNWKAHGHRILKGLLEGATGGLLALFGHFVTTEIIEGVKIYSLNMDKLRAEAPHFAKTVTDDVKFHGLIVDLDPALQKQLERWMANLGMHQKAHIVIRIVAMLLDETEGRPKALKALEQLASVTPDVYKTRRAVAFKLMKADESDYLGAQISGYAAYVFQSIVDELHEAKREMDAEERLLSDHVDTILNDLSVRETNWGWARGLRSILYGFTRAFGFRFS